MLKRLLLLLLFPILALLIVPGTQHVAGASQSDCLRPLYDVKITGPEMVGEGIRVPFSAVTLPVDASKPISYIWSPPPRSGQGTPQTVYLWPKAGSQQIKVVAANCGGKHSASYNVQIVAPDSQVVALRKLQKESLIDPSVRFEKGVPQYLKVRVPVPKALQDDPVEGALNFLEEYKELFLLNDPSQQLQLVRRTGTGREMNLFFRQVQQTIPIFGSNVAVRLVDNDVRSVSANYLPLISIDLVPKIGPRSAEKIAQGKGPQKQLCRIGLISLMIFDHSLFGNVPGDPHLVWRVSSSCDISDSAYVDAVTGAVLQRITHNPSVFDLSLFTANNNGAADGMTCFNGGNAVLATRWFDENGVLAGAAPDIEGNDAFSFIDQTYDYYHDLHNRDSFDNAGSEIDLYVHYGWAFINAGFRSHCGDLIFGDGWAVRDVVAHEFTHAVDYHSGDLDYLNESGALAESYSDVFAALVDDDDWLFGEDITGSFGPCHGLPFGTRRSLADPGACDDPDHMDEFEFLPADEDHDFGGVHSNSGIPNRIAHILAEGGVHADEPHITVTGIGRDKVGHIYYKTFTDRLHSSSDLDHAREMSIETAQTYAERREFGITDDDVCSVRNAFAAGGIGSPDIDCDGIEDNIDSDDDGDGVGDSRDNCPYVPNTFQTDTDDDGDGDACDSDDDGDGLGDDDDNCPLHANSCQYDLDGDGIGEACDDEDGDGVYNDGDGSCNVSDNSCDSGQRENCDDNCAFTYNYDQEDTNGNGIGDACDGDPDGDGIPTIFGDNCPFVANPDQADSDDDDYGDACDNCIDIPNDQSDFDEDGYGNECDNDDDEDGIRDGLDNCPFHYNPGQNDMDHNGQGSACDPTEGYLMTGDIHDWSLEALMGEIRFTDERISLNIPVYPCLSCRPPMVEDLKTEVILDMTQPFGVRIVDDEGLVIATDYSDLLRKTVTIAVPPNYDPPQKLPDILLAPSGAERTSNWAQSPEYMLQIFPTEETKPGKAYPVEIDVRSFTHKVSLPVISASN